jgi:hypothetical protein
LDVVGFDALSSRLEGPKERRKNAGYKKNDPSYGLLILELALVLEVSPKPLGLGVAFILAGIVDGYFLGRENYGAVFEVPPGSSFGRFKGRYGVMASR